jgi:hypothetical protein
MKNMIMVLMITLLSLPVLAQNNLLIATESSHNNDVYKQLGSYLQSQKKHQGLLSNKTKKWDSSRFSELYEQQHNVVKITSNRRITFMNGPVVFSNAPIYAVGEKGFIDKQYSPGNINPVIENTTTSTALGLLGIIAGSVLSSIYPKYVGSIYNSNGAALEAYMQSIYHQHDK